MTPRELEIIRHIAEGLTSKEIADRLGTSLKTIETHRQNIFRKLELGNAAQLVRYAIREGLVKPSGGGHNLTICGWPRGRGSRM